MKTVITEQIGKYTIIKQFDILMINPEGTKEKYQKKICNSQEFKTFEKLSLELRGYENNYCKHKISKKMFDQKRDEINLKLNDILKQLETLAKSLKADSSNLVYFECKKNEQILEDTTLEAKFKSLKSGQKLLLDGSIIEDNRGKIVFDKDLNSVAIGDLGPIPPDYKLDLTLQDLETIEQRNIKKMTTEERQNQFEIEKNNLLNKSVIDRSRLEISGKTPAEALKSTQDEYNNALNKIKTKYMV